jgi:hypothetical protein
MDRDEVADGGGPSICIPHLLHSLTTPSGAALKSLFVTHAQYKFVYKIACDLSKKSIK